MPQIVRIAYLRNIFGMGFSEMKYYIQSTQPFVIFIGPSKNTTSLKTPNKLVMLYISRIHPKSNCIKFLIESDWGIE